MTLQFHKMNGAGNDFIVIDNLDLSIQLSGAQISDLCDRQRGIGADGLLAVEPAEQGADFKFRYYNADGGEAEMCGNGARCFGKFAAQFLDEGASEVSFETQSGILTAYLLGENVRVAMSDPFDTKLDVDLSSEGISQPVNVINTGVPHAVIFVDDIENTNVQELGAALRYADYFSPKGTNVNFANIVSKDHIRIRTYERGVEAETLACGTGMVACALIHQLKNEAPSPIRVDVKGGETLEIGFQKQGDCEFSDVTLTGPAEFVFEGTISI